MWGKDYSNWDNLPKNNHVVCQTAKEVEELARRLRKPPVMPPVKNLIPVIPVVKNPVALIAPYPPIGPVFNMDTIIHAVAEEFDIPTAHLKATSQYRRITVPRQVAMMMCRRFLNRSYPQIARKLGLTDHTTVMSGIKRIHILRNGNEELERKIQSIARKLQEQFT